MIRTSRVKLRKYTRRTLLQRKSIVTVPEKTVKYVHMSARFTTMLSDMGVDRIGNYVRSMDGHAQVLEDMCKIGIIDDQILADEVGSISRETETVNADLIMINNTLIRFLHADSEKIKQPSVHGRRADKLQEPDHNALAQSLPEPAPAHTPQTAIAAGEARE